MVTPNTMINAHFFNKTIKVCKIILKTEQTTTLHAKWPDTHDIMQQKHHMITTKIDYQNSSRGIDVSTF